MKLAACIYCQHWDNKKERMKNKLYCKAYCKYRQKYEEFKARQYNELMFDDPSFGNENAGELRASSSKCKDCYYEKNDDGCVLVEYYEILIRKLRAENEILKSMVHQGNR